MLRPGQVSSERRCVEIVSIRQIPLTREGTALRENAAEIPVRARGHPQRRSTCGTS